MVAKVANFRSLRFFFFFFTKLFFTKQFKITIIFSSSVQIILEPLYVRMYVRISRWWVDNWRYLCFSGLFFLAQFCQ